MQKSAYYTVELEVCTNQHLAYVGIVYLLVDAKRLQWYAGPQPT